MSNGSTFVSTHCWANNVCQFDLILRSSFFEFGKILPHPREFDHYFLPRGQGIRQKNLPGWPGFARSKKISRKGGCTQLELTETLQSSCYLLHTSLRYYTIIYTLQDMARCKQLSLKPGTISRISRKSKRLFKLFFKLFIGI